MTKEDTHGATSRTSGQAEQHEAARAADVAGRRWPVEYGGYRIRARSPGAQGEQDAESHGPGRPGLERHQRTQRGPVVVVRGTYASSPPTETEIARLARMFEQSADAELAAYKLRKSAPVLTAGTPWAT